MYKVPKFLSNTILRSLDLQEINKNIKNASFLEYDDFEDGIISGLIAYTDENKIFVKKGIYKWNDEVTFLDKELSIKIPEKEGEYILYIKSKIEEEEYSINKIIYLELTNNKEKELELARFHIREGAKLNNNDYDIKKYNIEYNTLNFNEVIYSKTGINPTILKKWGNNMLNLNLKNAFDQFISSMCYMKIVNKNLLIKYICKTLCIEEKNYSNSKIIEYLYNILKLREDSNDFDHIENIEKINVD